MELLLTATFFYGRYHGRNDGQGNFLEWPPSPLRLFQALIAGSHRGVYRFTHQEMRDQALKWLESLPPPIIEAPPDRKVRSTNVTNYVPSNDNNIIHTRSATKSMDAILIRQDDFLIYRWSFSESEENKNYASVICAIASLVTHLGQHEDVISLEGKIQEQNEIFQSKTPEKGLLYQPNEGDSGKWKSPKIGALKAYQMRYIGIQKGESPFDYSIPLRQVNYKIANTLYLTNSPKALFKICNLEDNRSAKPFDPCKLREPAAMARNAMIEWLKKNSLFRRYYGLQMTSQLICGHESETSELPYNGPHIAFVPIPSIDDEDNADGWIRRILVVGFGCETGQAREMFEDVVSNLNGQLLFNQHRNKSRGRLVEIINQKDSILRFFVREDFVRENKKESYKVWRTFTPIILTGLTRKGRTPNQLIAKAFKQIGIPEEDIESIAVFRGPILPKTRHTKDYLVSGYLNQTPRYHAEVVFKRPVIGGPLVVGRGRYCGFGLMKPYSSEFSIDSEEMLKISLSNGAIHGQSSGNPPNSSEDA